MTYEPETGVIELYAEQVAIRNLLKKAFCESVLEQEDSPEKLKLRQINLEIFRQRPDFEDSFDLKRGVMEVTVKNIDIQTLPGRGGAILKATSRKFFDKDAYQTIEDLGINLLNPNRLRIRGVTLAFLCEAVGSLPKETITVKLRAPNGCSLRDLSQRERYLNHDLLVQMGVLLEDKDDEATSV